MANTLYPAVKKKILDQDTGLDFLASTIQAHLIDTADYTYSSAHDYADDLAGIEETATLSNKSTTSGEFDSDDPVFSAASGDPCEAIVLRANNGGASSADPLISFHDVSVILNGGNITANVDSNGWFYL